MASKDDIEIMVERSLLPVLDSIDAEIRLMKEKLAPKHDLLHTGKVVKSTTARLSSKNQVTLPKKVVDELGLESGDEFILEVREGEITLRLPPKLENQARRLSMGA
jgi:AbrB family looped-hinge helix DNA binding protein